MSIFQIKNLRFDLIFFDLQPTGKKRSFIALRSDSYLAGELEQAASGRKAATTINNNHRNAFESDEDGHSFASSKHKKDH